jgi:hypothetical protein
MRARKKQQYSVQSPGSHGGTALQQLSFVVRRSSFAVRRSSSVVRPSSVIRPSSFNIR